MSSSNNTDLEDQDNISDNTKEHPPDFKSEDPLDRQHSNLDAGRQNSDLDQNPKIEKQTEQDNLSRCKTPFSLCNKNMDNGILAPVPSDEQPGAETTISCLKAPGDADSCSFNSNDFSPHPEFKDNITMNGKHLELESKCKKDDNSCHPSNAFTDTPIFNLSNKTQGSSLLATLPEDKQASDEYGMKYLNPPKDNSCSSDSDAERQTFLPEHDSSEKKCETETHQHKASFGMSVFNLSNHIMGSGILGLSFAMANTGIIQFVILLVLAAVSSLYSIHLLLKTAKAGGALVYETLGNKAFGMPGKLATSCSITMQNIGAISSYLYIIKYELPVVIQSFTEASDGEWYLNGNYLVMLVSVVVILPLSLLTNLGYLAYTSGLSVLCMVFFLIVVIIKKFQIPCPLPFPDTLNESMHMLNSTPHSDNVTSDDDTCKPKYFVYNSQTVYAVPILAYAFTCHPTILPIYEELKDRSRKKMQNVANVSFLAMFIMYLLTALFGYLTFNIHVEAELLHTYSRFYKYDVLLQVVRLAVLAAVTLTVPVVLFPIRASVNHILFPTKDFSWIRHIIIAVVLLVVTNVLVIFVPSIRDIFGFIGASAAPAMIFILPSAFYIKLVKKESMKSVQKIVAMMFLILGFVVMFGSMSLIIYDWTTQGH